MIIENSKLQSKPLRSAWLAMTMLLWLAYIYLWLPLISLIAWWLGYKTFQYQMITLNGFMGLQKLLQVYLCIILLLGALLVCWAKLENLRFKNKARRSNASKRMNAHAVAEYFNLAEPTLSQMQTKKKVLVKFNHKGEIAELQEHAKNVI